MTNWLVRYRPYLLMLFLFVIVLAGTIYLLRRPEPSAMVITTPTPKPTPTVASLVVDVRGAVNKPGVYTLPAGSRVQDALALAGDVLANADTRVLNPARKLNDGEQIYVPVQGEATPIPPTSSRSTTSRTPTPAVPAGKININTATLAELDTLPGIGATIAQRIIDYRTQNGNFQKIDDLKKVRGIGDALFAQIKDLITVE